MKTEYRIVEENSGEPIDQYDDRQLLFPTPGEALVYLVAYGKGGGSDQRPLRLEKRDVYDWEPVT